jgi:hypothetical protein
MDGEQRQFLGPARIVSLKDRLRSRAWVCSSCKHTMTSDTPIPVQAPCSKCGGLAFEMVDQPLQ